MLGRMNNSADVQSGVTSFKDGVNGRELAETIE